MITVIAFDFDGVVSPGGENLKQGAWDILAADQSDDFKSALKRERDLNFSGAKKGSRYEILTDTLKAVDTEKRFIPTLVAFHAARYNDIVQKEIVRLGVTDDVLQTLIFHSKFATLYVNSATPEHAVQESCKALGITRFFKKILGQPATKTKNLQAILDWENISREQLLFVGDGPSDIKAAAAVGCRFVGVRNDSNHWTDHEDFPTVGTLTELSAHLG